MAVGGGITSNLPSGENFDASLTPAIPGVIASNGGLDHGSGGVSSTNWEVNALFSTSLWTDSDYTAIKNRIWTNVTPDSINSSVDSLADLTSGALQSDGAYYVTASSFNITVNIDLGTNKVVMISDGDVNIDGKINLNDNSGFLMILAGGNITVNPSVGTSGDPSLSNRTPELEGLFVANTKFDTGSNSTKTLRVEGVVAAGQGITFGRVPSVTTYPGEFFKFRPDLVSLIPMNVLGRSTKWQELAP